MPKYMPQEVFDYGALVLARAIYLKKDALEVARQLEAGYRNTYADDGLARDWLMAANGVIKAMPDWFKQPGMDDGLFANACLTLAHAMERYEPSGKKKGKWFRGAWFSGEKQPIATKAQRTPINAAIYHFAIVAGQINPNDLK